VVKFLRSDEKSGETQLVMILTAKDMLQLGGDALEVYPERELGRMTVEVGGQAREVASIVLLAGPDEESILSRLGVGKPPFAVRDRVVVRSSGATGVVTVVSTRDPRKPQWKIVVRLDALGERAFWAAELELAPVAS
jgi:hypothetical protein